MDWKKKDVPAETIKEISKKYACDLLMASILARRGVTEPGGIQYYLENEKTKFWHFSYMSLCMMYDEEKETGSFAMPEET